MSGNASEERQQEIDRLTQQLDHMEQELLERYCDVGKYVLEKLEKENKEIDQLVDQVIEVKRKLVKVKGQIRCPNCYQYNEPDSVYCCKCGKKLEKEEEDTYDS